MAWAGRPPTRRFSRPFRSASTSARKAASSRPPSSAMVVTDLLLESFNDLFDVTYTARMEAELDEIEEGKIDWRVAMSEFYERFTEGPGTRRRAHDRHQAHGGAHRPGSARSAASRMVIKWGKHGKFIACTGYPECTNTRELPAAETGEVSEQDEAEILRQLRPSDGAQEGPLRAVLGVHRLSGLQDHQAVGRGAEAEGRAAGREMSAAAATIWSRSSAATASSSRAAIIRPASSSSRRPSA